MNVCQLTFAILLCSSVGSGTRLLVKPTNKQANLAKAHRAKTQMGKATTTKTTTTTVKSEVAQGQQATTEKKPEPNVTKTPEPNGTATQGTATQNQPNGSSVGTKAGTSKEGTPKAPATGGNQANKQVQQGTAGSTGSQTTKTKDPNDIVGAQEASSDDVCPTNAKGIPVNGNCECANGFACFDTSIKDSITEDLKEFPDSKSKDVIKANLNNQSDTPGCAAKTRFGEPGVRLYTFSSKCKHCECRKEIKKPDSGGVQGLPSLIVLGVAALSASHFACL